jgi:hypothetical protein
LQRQWESTHKGAQCTSFFPTVEQRLNLKIPLSPEFTAIVSGHGITKSYLHRFKLADNPTCPCNEGAQTSEHLIYICKIIETQRKTLKHKIKTSRGTWPTTNIDLAEKYSHAFSSFIKSVDFQKNCNSIYNGSQPLIPGTFNLQTTLNQGKFLLY